MSSLNLKIPLALKNGKTIHISEVEQSGLACGCRCPACNELLEARRHTKDPSEYKFKHTDYFAHSKRSKCEYGAESALHYLAKEVIEKEKRITLPVKKHSYPHFHNEVIIPEISLEVDKVTLEPVIDNIRPDVLIESRGQKLMLEIGVTHFIDKEKKEKIEKIGISTIEIDLKRYDMFEVDREKLKSIIIDDTKEKKWIFNTKFKQLVEKRRNELKDQIAAKDKEDRERSLKVVELEKFYCNYKLPIEKRSSKGAWNGKLDLWQVSPCPMEKRYYGGRYYANIHVDCYNCRVNGKKAFKGFRDDKTTIVCLAEYYLRK